MRGCEEGFRASKSAQAELSPVFETVEHAFDDVAAFGEAGVVFELNLAVLSRRNTDDGFGLFQPLAQMICVISPVRNNLGSLFDVWLKTLPCLRNVSSVARCQMYVNRPASPIADEVEL